MLNGSNFFLRYFKSYTLINTENCFQAAQMGWIDLSIMWFARRKLEDSHLSWQENGLNFLYDRNATIGLDSSFYVFTFKDYGKSRQQI